MTDEHLPPTDELLHIMQMEWEAAKAQLHPDAPDVLCLIEEIKRLRKELAVVRALQHKKDGEQ